MAETITSSWSRQLKIPRSEPDRDPSLPRAPPGTQTAPLPRPSQGGEQALWPPVLSHESSHRLDPTLMNSRSPHCHSKSPPPISSHLDGGASPYESWGDTIPPIAVGGEEEMFYLSNVSVLHYISHKVIGYITRKNPQNSTTSHTA